MSARTMKEAITYWAPVSEGQFGGKSYSGPTSLKGRWEQKFETVIDPRGQDIVSKGRIFTETELKNAGYIYLGETNAADPTEVVGAQEIRIVTSIPNTRTNTRLFVAYI